MHARLDDRLESAQATAYLRSTPSSRREWSDAEGDPFAALLSTKIRCVAPLLGFSFVFIIGTTLLAGFAKDFMGQKVFGSFNLGYLLVLLSYVVCWVVSVLYVRMANQKFDAQASRLIEASQARRAA